MPMHRSLRRTLPVVAMLAVGPMDHASAQPSGLPWWFPGRADGALALDTRQSPPSGQSPPSPCQQLISLRDQVQKNRSAISAASERHATALEACKLFKVFLATESKMISAIDTNGPFCGLPPAVSEQLSDAHTEASRMAKQVCDAANGLPSGPDIRDQFLKIASEGGRISP
jgi:hypothetical protein